MGDYNEYTFRLAFRDGGSVEHKVAAKTQATAFVAVAHEATVYASRVMQITYVSDTPLKL